MAIVHIFDQDPQQRLAWRLAFEKAGHEVHTFLEKMDLETASKRRSDLLFLSLRAEFDQENRQILRDIVYAKRQMALVVVVLDIPSIDLEKKLFNAGVIEIYQKSRGMDDIIHRSERLVQLRIHDGWESLQRVKKVLVVAEDQAMCQQFQNVFILKGCTGHFFPKILASLFPFFV